MKNGERRWKCQKAANQRVRRPEDPNRKRPYRRFKKDTCERCGFVPEHPRQLDVHHVDGNHSNNEPTNLRTLCANCHRLNHRLRFEH